MLNAHSAGGPQSFQYVHGGRIAALWRADLRTLHHVANCDEHLAGDGDPFLARGLGGSRPRHPLEDGIGHRDAEFVLHEFRVASTDQRPYACNHGNPAMLDSAQKSFQQRQIEDGLSNRKLGAGLDLIFEAADLFINVQHSWVGADSNRETGSRADWVSADIEAAVQAIHNIHQPHRVHVENRRGVRVAAHLRRAAGAANQIADADSCRDQQIRLDAKYVAGSATALADCFNSRLLLLELRQSLVNHGGPVSW